MAIKKSFGGQSIVKPGAYSRTSVDNSSGAPLASNNTLLLVGESTKGASGATEGIQEFTAEQMNELVAKYGAGPLVDCAVAAIRPSNTPSVGGAGKIMIWKTNAATQASLTVNEATNTNPLLVFKDKAYGVDGNKLSITIANGTNSGTQKLISVLMLGGTTETLGENDGTAVLSIEYTGDASTAAMTITGASKAAKTLAVTLAGDQTDGSTNLSIALVSYTMKELVDFINTKTGYAATLLDATKAANIATELDPKGSTSITTALSLYRIQEEIVALVNENSDRVTCELHATPRAGLPVNVTASALTGGARGASTNTNFSNGFAASLAKDVNIIVPCISRDATADISDSLTDGSSSYTITSVLAALSSHLTLRGNIKNRKEAQGIAGFRDAQKADCYAQARTLADYQIQLCIEDVYVLDASGSLAWKQPHVKAAMCAGIRLGTPVGEPLTHKTLKVFGKGHVVNTTTGIAAGDYNDALDVENAIEAGLLVSENLANGAVRIVCDCTTYGADQSFVFNRGSVIEAAQYVAKTLRQTAEEVFVGKKVSNGAASSIKNVLRSKLLELNAPDVNIITSSSDAPNGFREDTFTVQVTGNTATVSVHIKPVQSLDFVLLNLELGDISQTA